MRIARRQAFLPRFRVAEGFSGKVLGTKVLCPRNSGTPPHRPMRLGIFAMRAKIDGHGIDLGGQIGFDTVNFTAQAIIEGFHQHGRLLVLGIRFLAHTRISRRSTSCPSSTRSSLARISSSRISRCSFSTFFPPFPVNLREPNPAHTTPAFRASQETFVVWPRAIRAGTQTPSRKLQTIRPEPAAKRPAPASIQHLQRPRSP